jgi:hypothetical protein
MSPLPESVSAGWVWGCLYLAACGAWAWCFRSRVDSWVRRLAGKWLGTPVVWVPASTFPLEIWMWGVATRDGSQRAARLALGSLVFCFAGAFLPTVAFALLLRWTDCIPDDVASAVYLSTPALIVLFAASHLSRRGLERRIRPSHADAE